METPQMPAHSWPSSSRLCDEEVLGLAVEGLVLHSLHLRVSARTSPSLLSSLRAKNPRVRSTRLTTSTMRTTQYTHTTGRSCPPMNRLRLSLSIWPPSGANHTGAAHYRIVKPSQSPVRRKTAGTRSEAMYGHSVSGLCRFQ